MQSIDLDVSISRQNNKDQHPLFHEAINEVKEQFLKTSQFSLKKGIAVFGKEGKQLAMKKILNLAGKMTVSEKLHVKL